MRMKAKESFSGQEGWEQVRPVYFGQKDWVPAPSAPSFT